MSLSIQLCVLPSIQEYLTGKKWKDAFQFISHHRSQQKVAAHPSDWARLELITQNQDTSGKKIPKLMISFMFSSHPG